MFPAAYYGRTHGLGAKESTTPGEKQGTNAEKKQYPRIFRGM